MLDKWSSYSRFIDGCGAGVVDVTDILSYFDSDMSVAGRRYKEFVESGISEEVKNPFKEVLEGIILGREGFIEKVKEFVKEKPRDRELPALRRLQPEVPIDKIVRSISDYYLLNGADLRKRTRRYAKQRKVAIYLSKVVNAEKNPVIAKYFGISPQGVSNVITEIESELEISSGLKEEIKEIEVDLTEKIAT